MTKNLGGLKINSLDNAEGWGLNELYDVVQYLAYCRFLYDYVDESYIYDAVMNCINELGCVYEDLDELESDIRRYYI